MMFEFKGKQFYIDGLLKRELEKVKNRVINHDWDYISVIAGDCGAGKSTFSRTLGAFFDKNFSNDNICFSAKEFIEKTSKFPKNSAIILDESFLSLNAQASKSIEFLKIISHLQLIRQRNLFIFLLLPNFFDLSKSVALFRTHHLFVVYASDEGERGRFRVFDKNGKRVLFVKGQKFCNYYATHPNFIGAFRRNVGIVDEKLYEKRKEQHLLEQQENIEKRGHGFKFARDRVMLKLQTKYGLKTKEIADVFDLGRQQICDILKNYADEE